MHIVHMAAENDSLPNAKVGGVADVVRDIAPALADLGHRVSVLMPAYGFLHRARGAEWVADIHFPFRGASHHAGLYQVPAVKGGHALAAHYVIHHPVFEAEDPDTGQYRIYVHDPEGQPFFSDGTRFACFCSAAAAAVTQGAVDGADVLHLHDWHAALVALLRRSHPFFKPLKSLKTVFTIHNAALQGVRPLAGSSSSLSAWFPEMHWHWMDVADPRWPHTCNLLACGIRLADRIHTVSPTYAREICRPDDPPRFYGAHGLEAVLSHEKEQGTLTGILNGCGYPVPRRSPVMDFSDMIDDLKRQVLAWSADRSGVSSAAFVAAHRLSGLHSLSRPRMLVCSVSRLTEQKVLLLGHGRASGRPALARILEALGDDGVYVLLGSGQERYERFFTQLSARFSNFVFLNGFSDETARVLYANGDLFLMPSSFEPCGIGQMLAMRDGQPCVVHAVGGLRDTVRHDVNGFCFEGRDLDEQALNFVDTTCRAMDICRQDPEKWARIKENAAAARFLWQETARAYVEKLYRSPREMPAEETYQPPL